MRKGSLYRTTTALRFWSSHIDYETSATFELKKGTVLFYLGTEKKDGRRWMTFLYQGMKISGWTLTKWSVLVEPL